MFNRRELRCRLDLLNEKLNVKVKLLLVIMWENNKQIRKSITMDRRKVLLVLMTQLW